MFILNRQIEKAAYYLNDLEQRDGDSRRTILPGKL